MKKAILKKKSVVYVNKEKVLINILKVDDLEKLISYMSESAFLKADAKIGLRRNRLFKFCSDQFFNLDYLNFRKSYAHNSLSCN